MSKSEIWLDPEKALPNFSQFTPPPIDSEQNFNVFVSFILVHVILNILHIVDPVYVFQFYVWHRELHFFS